MDCHPANLSVRNEFISRLECSPLDDGVNWVTNSALKYIDPWGELITIPAGFKSDFASIPDLSRIASIILAISVALGHWVSAWFYCITVLAWFICLIAESFLHEGTWDWIAMVHDYAFKTRCRSFWRANWILFVGMKAKGAPITPLWKRICILAGVCLGGYIAWVQDKPR